MTEGPADASGKLRLVLDYLPCEACLSQPVAPREQELLCSVCRRLDRDVDATMRHRVTVLLERPTPVVALAPPVPLPPPAETDVPAPVDEAPVPPPAEAQEPLAAEPAPLEAAPPQPPEEAAQPEEAPKPSRYLSLFRRRKDAPAQTEPAPEAEAAPAPKAAPEPAPAPEPAWEPMPAPERTPEPEAIAAEPVEEPPREPAPEPARAEQTPLEAAPETTRKRGFSLFRRKKEPAADVASPAEEEPLFDDVAGFEPRDDGFEFVRDEPASARASAAQRRQEPEPFEDSFEFTPPEPRREERPAEAVAPYARDELEDDFLYRRAPEPQPEPAAAPEPLLAEEPVEVPQEEVPVEPAEGPNPWAPPEDFLLDEPPARDEAREPDLAPAREAPREREPHSFLAPSPAELEAERVFDAEVLPDDPAPQAAEPARWEPAPEDEEIIETEIVELEIVEDDEPAPLEAPPAERAPAPAWTRAPEPAPEPARPYEPVRAEEPRTAEPARAQEPPREEKPRRSLASLFRRKKSSEPAPAPEAEPARAAEPAALPEPEPARADAWREEGAATPSRYAEEIPELAPSGEAAREDDATPAAAPSPSWSPAPGAEDALVAGPGDAPIAAGADLDRASDLYRLAGFTRRHHDALAAQRIESISHLSGHDPIELADRTDLDAFQLTSWVHVADLVQEVGIPLDGALALVAAGVDGPRGLRDMDARAIVDRVTNVNITIGDPSVVTLQNVKRWKRRA